MAAVVAVLAASPAFAAAPAAWVVDHAASSVRFSSTYSGEAFTGTFGRWDADIRFDPANPAAASVTASIDVASAHTGDADRDTSLPQPTFFSAAKFPRATFVAHGFKALGGGRYVTAGTLTLRGVSKPLTLPFTLAIAGADARMATQISLNRLAFGIGQDEWKKTDALPANVTVVIALAAHRR